MNPVPIPSYMEAAFPEMRKHSVGKPGWSGEPNDQGDGSSAQEAATLEALSGWDEGYRCFREAWQLGTSDHMKLQSNGLIMLTFWVPSQMPVHAMQVIKEGDV